MNKRYCVYKSCSFVIAISNKASKFFLMGLVLVGLPVAAETNYCVSDYCSKNRPACEGVGDGVDYSGQTLTNTNFANRPKDYLVGANFKGATLIGVNFANVDLTLADFTDVKTQANKDGARTDFKGAILTKTCFTGSDLAGADLEFATYKQTDFTCASMIDAKIGPMITVVGGADARTRFNYTQLGIARSTDSFLFPLNNMAKDKNFWKSTEFTCTRFIGLSADNFEPAGLDMTDAYLRGIVLDGFNFYDTENNKGVTLNGADLSGSSFTNANLSYAKLDGATLKRTNLSGANLTEANFFTSNAANLLGAKLNNTILNEATLDHAIFTAAQLNGTQARGATFKNATFQATPTDNVASITGSSFDSADFSNAALNSVAFRLSSLNNASLTNLTLSGTSFTHSQLIGADFEGAELQDVDFSNSNINNANFKSTKITATKTGAGVNYFCTQLGGSSFSSATVAKASFEAAVLPPDSACCPQEGNTFFCGNAINGAVYGHTTLPSIPSGVSVMCPNGDTGSCSGKDWQIPNWTTNLCNNDQKPEVVWSKPQCGHQPPTVNIPDENLKACVQQALFGGSQQPITKAAAKNLKYLSCANSGIKDLTGLTKDNFPALITLDLSANELAGSGDFSQFSQNLESIKLSYNDYTQLILSPNAQTRLNHLEASNNKITSVSVSADTYLAYIDLSYNKLSGTQKFFMQRDNNVEYLDLSFNQITSIGDASVLTDAQTIYLQSNKITTIGSVKNQWANGSGSLYYLGLDKNACFQCGTLGVSESYYSQFGCSCDQSLCGTCK